MKIIAGARSKTPSTPTRLAACVRALMAECSSWAGSAADLLRATADHSRDGMGRDRTGWPQNPRALAGRLRRAQSFLRALGIEIGFGREGHAGSRVIRIYTTPTSSVSTASSVGDHGPRSGQVPPRPADDVCDDNYLCNFPSPIGQASFTAADDADGADANPAFHFG
jgi:hypothetical protein